MDIRPSFQLQTVIKAMTDVILPAVDPNNKLAQEQAGLVIAILNLIAQRMPLIYRYEGEELARFLELAGQLHKHAKDFRGMEAVLHSAVRHNGCWIRCFYIAHAPTRKNSKQPILRCVRKLGT